MTHVSLGVIFNPGSSSLESGIFWGIRVPRILVSFLAGAALAVSGMAFQAMFRNPLATPFTLGVSSGASLGAAIYVHSGVAFAILGISGVSCSAFLGSILAILLVYGLTQFRKGFSTATMLLAGVAVNFFCSSVMLFIQYMSDLIHSFRILRWLMGGLEVAAFDSVFNMLPFVVIGSVIVLFLTQELNLMTVGEDIAVSRGVDVKKIKPILFIATSLMIGGVVAVCGPIAFIGMMVPHICRLIMGPEHVYLMPATFLFGGAFLTICDTVSRTLIAPAEIPVGVITSLLGAPFFMWLLLGRASRASIW
ncbi:MAG: iron ABC transporter permease [Deltaproteobacteria bacterium]|nr:iron ABC transporter permease [Deltaproteobacteria bacterium]MBW2085331.1 iron ABC transporter permease [Deltaproteobacteria bacterium]